MSAADRECLLHMAAHKENNNGVGHKHKQTIVNRILAELKRG